MKILIGLVLLAGLIAVPSLALSSDGFGLVGAHIGYMAAPDYLEGGGFEDSKSVSYGADGIFLFTPGQGGLSFGGSVSYTMATFEAEDINAEMEFKYLAFAPLIGSVNSSGNGDKTAFWVGYEFASTELTLDVNEASWLGSHDLDVEGNAGAIVAGLGIVGQNNFGFYGGMRYIMGIEDSNTYELYIGAGFGF